MVQLAFLWQGKHFPWENFHLRQYSAQCKYTDTVSSEPSWSFEAGDTTQEPAKVFAQDWRINNSTFKNTANSTFKNTAIIAGGKSVTTNVQQKKSVLFPTNETDH